MPDRIDSQIAVLNDTAERMLEVCGEISAAAGRIGVAGASSSASSVTLNGGGIVAIVITVIAVFSCVISTAGLMIVRAQQQASETTYSVTIQQLRHEVEKLSRDVETHQVYITEFRRQSVPAQPAKKE